MSRPMPLCALCHRAARGFGFRQPGPRTPPVYAFCSMACMDAAMALIQPETGIMIDKTEQEQAAIQHARRYVAEALLDLGLMAPFYDRKPEEIDQLIEAALNGFQDGMSRQQSGLAI